MCAVRAARPLVEPPVVDLGHLVIVAPHLLRHRLASPSRASRAPTWTNSPAPWARTASVSASAIREGRLVRAAPGRLPQLEEELAPGEAVVDQERLGDPLRPGRVALPEGVEDGPCGPLGPGHLKRVERGRRARANRDLEQHDRAADVTAGCSRDHPEVLVGDRPGLLGRQDPPEQPGHGLRRERAEDDREAAGCNCRQDRRLPRGDEDEPAGPRVTLHGPPERLLHLPRHRVRLGEDHQLELGVERADRGVGPDNPLDVRENALVLAVEVRKPVVGLEVGPALGEEVAGRNHGRVLVGVLPVQGGREAAHGAHPAGPARPRQEEVREGTPLRCRLQQGDGPVLAHDPAEGRGAVFLNPEHAPAPERF